MHVARLDHFTVRCRPQELDELRDFCVGVLGLGDGARPDFAFPGHWLYADGRPIVHLAAVLDTRPAQGTGPLDHLAFTCRGLDDMVRRLKAMNVPFDERPVPGFPLHQVFFSDPQGLRLELTFEVRQEGAQA